ncbi:MAG TPA: hypothetical protein VMV68_08040 [Spirochaetia bacterium]|nr:hypothetical protein [Spirochaetia bacterium]
MRAGGERFLVRALLFAACAGAYALPLFGQDLSHDFYVHEFWTELEPMVFQSGQAGPLTKDEAVRQILTEAQYVFSGELYGFTFSWTPGDPRRAISDSFTLRPVAQIKWGDPNLRVLDTRVENRRLIARVMYTLAPFQESWKQGWDSNVYPTATGRGEGNYLLGFNQKIASYEDAVKEAIHGYLRERVLNRPNKVTGQVVFSGEPYTVIEAGKYVTTLTVKLKIDKVVPYTVF